MSLLAERLNKALEHARQTSPGTSKAGLSRACAVRTATISAWFSGATKELSPEKAKLAADYLNVSAMWLLTGEGEMLSNSVQCFDEYDELDEAEFVEIPEFEAKCAAGSGEAVFYDEVTDSIPARYRRSWFQARGINPQNCKRFKVRGTSMEPLLWDGDTILVDCAPQPILSGKIYAFMLFGEMRVKALFPMLRNKGLLIKSINPDCPPETLEGDELSTFRLIGRVRDRSGDGMF